MKIYIPTLGRSDKQITFLNLPKFLQEKTHLVVQPAEKHLYDNFPIIVLPENDIGSSRTRQFIYDLAGESLWGIIDDDILMKERRPKEKPTKIPMNEDGWKYFYDKTVEWLKTDFSFVGVRRGNLPPNGKEYVDNSETIVCVFYNGYKIPKSNELVWNHDLFCGDVNLNMQLLLKGHKNRVWCKYGYVADWGQKGGCQHGIRKRTPELQEKSHQKLVETFSEFVKWKTQNGKISISNNKNLSGYKMIKCYYNKAAKYSDVNRLYD